MAKTVEQFAKAVVAAGLSTGDEIKSLWATLPTGARPRDGEGLSKVLVNRNLLTEFQASQLLEGSATPLVLGDYVLLSKIGAGGMGQVFKARHRHMERVVAIKLLPAELTKDDDAVKRFQREVKAAAKLSHPNIVQAHDASVQRGVWYLVMEYVEGCDLAAAARQQGTMPVSDVVNYIAQAARGLAFAHGKGVVHRDIKPANLLLDAEGTVKILDMGLARIDDAAAQAAQQGLTQSGQVMGTVDYMAPEQAFDTRSANARADIYSLGCTLYRLLTGQNIYDGETLVAKLMAHQTKPIPSLVARRPDVPQSLEQIYERMVAKSPDDRFQTMAEVEQSLAALLSANQQGSTATQPLANDNLTAFLQTMPGSKKSPAPQPATKVGATLPSVSISASPDDGTTPTISLSRSQQANDPVSERSIQIARDATLNPAARPPRKARPHFALIAAGFGMLLLVLFGVWVIVRDKDGKEVARIPVPPGGKVEVETAREPAETAKTPTNSAGESAGGVFALRFQDRTLDLAEGPNPGVDLMRPFTVEVYVTPGALPTSGYPVGMFGCDEEFGVSIHKNAWAFYTYHNFVEAPTPLEPHRRVHLAGVRTLNQRLLYVDGKLVASKDEPIQTKLDLKRKPLSIALGSSEFSFAIDELRISQGTPYTQEFTPPTRLTADKETLLLYHFDEGEGDVLKDSSGNNHHGKIVGAKWVKINDSSPSPTQTPFAASAAPRWPLAPTKPEDIKYLLECGVAIHLRTDATNFLDLRGKSQPPAESGTVVQAMLWDVDKSKANDELLRRLGQLSDLERIGINFNPGVPGKVNITTEGVKHLGALIHLRTFELANFTNSDIDLAYLVKMQHLETLNLAGRQIDWCQYAAQVPSLRNVNLFNTPLSENDLLTHLVKLPRLEKLTLNHSEPGEAALRQFAEKLPWCRIEARQIKIEPRAPVPLAANPPAPTTPPLAKAPFDAAQAKAHQEAWAKYLATPVETKNSIGMQMTLIPPGEFLMGSSDADIKLALKIAEETKLAQSGVTRIQEERPHHKVRITQPFRLSAHEVTIGQFAKFIEQSKYKTQAEEFGGNSDKVKPEEMKPDSLNPNWRTPNQAVTDDCPVTQVSWNDAVAFCNWLSGQEQLTPWYQRDGDSWTLLPKANGYRLPTEAEWEYACRAGTMTQYSFGDNWQDHDKFGWSNKNAGGRPHAVGSLPANPFGLYDMHGNVWEWCQDWYDVKYYDKSPSDDPLGPSRASERVNRGGSWYFVPSNSRSSYRLNYSPSYRNGDRGFRPILGTTQATAGSARVTAVGDFALQFQDRTLDRVEGPNPGVDLMRPFTVEVYVTPGALPTSGNPVGMFGCDEEFGVRIHKNAWAFYTYHNFVEASTPLEPHRRVHLAGVRTLNQKLLYVDGKLVASKDEPILTKLDLKRKPLNIALTSSEFSFAIDEFRITQGTPYTQEFTPPTRLTADKETLLLYHFDEGEGDVLKDSSGNNHHGKIVGAKWVRANGAPMSPTGYSLDLSGTTAEGSFPQVRLPGKLKRGQPCTVELTVTARTVAGPKMNRGVWGFMPWLSLKQYENRWAWIAATKDDQGRPLYSKTDQLAIVTPGKPTRLALVFTGSEMQLFGRSVPPR